MNKAISISREFGSGGRAIGKLLAEELGFNFFDNKLVRLAAKRSGLSLDSALKADEKAINPWLYTPSVLGGLYSTIYDSDSERMYRVEQDIIREEAQKGNCVFVGRSANQALSHFKDVQLVSYFIYAPEDWRLKRVIETEGFKNEKEALHALRKKDRQRKNYYNYFTGEEYTNPLNYDLCVDSSYLGIEKTAELLKQISGTLFDNFRVS